MGNLIGTQGYIIYTNPNNTNNYAYIATGCACKDVKSDVREYPGSYQILFSGRGQTSFEKSLELVKNMGYSIK